MSVSNLYISYCIFAVFLFFRLAFEFQLKGYLEMLLLEPFGDYQMILTFMFFLFCFLRSEKRGRERAQDHSAQLCQVRNSARDTF